MKKARAYWLHRGSGLVWAVETAAGKVTACAGPLAREDAIPLILDYVAYRASSDAMWVQSHRDEFTDLPSEGPSPSQTHELPDRGEKAKETGADVQPRTRRRNREPG